MCTLTDMVLTEKELIIIIFLKKSSAVTTFQWLFSLNYDSYTIFKFHLNYRITR